MSSQTDILPFRAPSSIDSPKLDPTSSSGLTRTKITEKDQSEETMVGPLEKGVSLEKVIRPPAGIYEGLDLRTLPKYICFKAALLKSQITLQYVTGLLVVLLIAQIWISRRENTHLNELLRRKEYILAPGVMDFTPASVDTVPESYIQAAVSEFIAQLGNFTADTIEEQYRGLSDSMSPDLKVKFLKESSELIDKVKDENISELIGISQKTIKVDAATAKYLAVIEVRRDTYINHEYIGEKNEIIEMELKLIPPKNGKRWFLQIEKLTRQSAETYQAKKKF